MKRFLLVFACMMIGLGNVFAQQTDTTKITKNNVIRLCCGGSKDKALIVFNKVVVANNDKLQGLNPNLISDIKVLNRMEATKLYGALGKAGAILILTKKPIKWIPVAAILKKNKVSPIDQQLPIVFFSHQLMTDSIMGSKGTKYTVSQLNTVQNPVKDLLISGNYLLITETK